MVLHDVQAHSLFYGDLFLRSGKLVPEFYVGSKRVLYRCVIICGFGISHTEEKSSCVSLHSYLILFLQCQVFDSKNHQFLNKKNYPNTIKLFPQTPQVFYFFSPEKPSNNGKPPKNSFFFLLQSQEKTILKSSTKAWVLSISSKAGRVLAV